MHWTSWGRPDITIERIAINIDDARIADNEGNQPVDVPVRRRSDCVLVYTSDESNRKNFAKRVYRHLFHRRQAHSFVITYSMDLCMN